MAVRRHRGLAVPSAWLRVCGSGARRHAGARHSPWWLELLSTGFDPDAGCALVRGVLHAPLDTNAGPPPWRMSLDDPAIDAQAPVMPLDAMGVRLGR